MPDHDAVLSRLRALSGADREPLPPHVIAAAWGAWQSRHGGKLGPGPAFREAIEAAIAARSAPVEAKQPVARVWSVSEAVAPPGMQVACVKVTVGQSLKVGDRLYSAPLPPLYAAPPLAQDVINLVVAAREFWDANNDLSAESKALDKALEPFAGRVPYENELDEASAALASDRKEGKAND
jgi:hypothetical protein